jgi:hypothetical protein
MLSRLHVSGDRVDEAFRESLFRVPLSIFGQPLARRRLGNAKALCQQRHARVVCALKRIVYSPPFCDRQAIEVFPLLRNKETARGVHQDGPRFDNGPSVGRQRKERRGARTAPDDSAMDRKSMLQQRCCDR